VWHYFLQVSGRAQAIQDGHRQVKDKQVGATYDCKVYCFSPIGSLGAQTIIFLALEHPT
jgi:hypothetical protein